MKRTFVATAAAAAALTSVTASVAAAPEGRGVLRPAGPMNIDLEPVGTFDPGAFDGSAAEIVAHDPATQQLFVVNALAGALDVLDVSDPGDPVKVGQIDATDVAQVDATEPSINSVAVNGGTVAVAVEADDKTDSGWAAFFTTDGAPITAVELGALPDMITFSPNGNWVLVANEGEPADGDDGYASDPVGSISVIDVSGPLDDLDDTDVRTAGFEAFDAEGALPAGVRVFGPEDVDGDPDTAPLPSENLEPEYVVIDQDNATAYAVLQENNAMAVIDIASATVTELWPLGAKDLQLPGNELDPSDRDGGINIDNWPVYGLYMPDGFAAYSFRGETYLVTANEGDGRDYDAYSEEVRVKDLGNDGVPGLCADVDRLDEFVAASSDLASLDDLRKDEHLGRLTITLADGLHADGSCYEALYAFGGRSFSIWSTDGDLVYDSGSDFESIIAELIDAGGLPADAFNANNDENDSFESRSDNKGPEPEAIAIGKVAGRTYAFVGLERIGGIMVYDITDPRAPHYVQYVTTRDFEVDAQNDDGTTNPDVGDLGPEGVIFIGAGDSPTQRPMLAVGNEVSGTTTLFDISIVTPGRGPHR